MEDDYESSDDESTALRYDFMVRLRDWKKNKLPHEVNILSAKNIGGIKVDPFEVHFRIEDYDLLTNQTDGVKQLMIKLAKDFGPEKLQLKQRTLDRMKNYVEVLKNFHQDPQAKKDTERGPDTIIKRALETLNAQRESINNFLEEKSKHIIDPAINSAVKQLLEVLGKACEDIMAQDIGKGETDNESNKALRRTITWLGQNGIGKSFCINLLLMLSERPHWQYHSTGDTFEAVIEEHPARSSENDYATEDDEDTVVETKAQVNVSHKIARSELSTLVADGQMYIVTPNKTDFDGARNKAQPSFPTQEEIELEQEYLGVVRDRASDYSAWRRLATLRDNHFPSYMLTSAGQMSIKSTTMHATSIRSGARWHFKVKYKTLPELEKELRDYDFDTSHRAYQNAKGKTSGDKGWDKERCLYHETMLHLLRAVHKDGRFLSPSSSFRPAEALLGAVVDFEEELQDPIAKLFPREGEAFPFAESIKKIAGLTLVFVGDGKDALKDRIYIRRMLHGVLFQGLFSNFDAPPGTVRPSSAPKAGKDADVISPDRLIISEVVVYAPSILLEGRVQWQDAPGTNDTSPEKYTNLVDALETCDGLMIFRDREQDAQLLEIFKDHVVPRIWESTENARFGNFLLNEKQFTDAALALARNTITVSTEMQRTRRDMMTPIFHAIMDQRQNGNPEQRTIVKKAVTQSLNSGTWHVFPLMYTSLVLNSDSRLNFEKIDAKEWNPANNPLLSVVPTKRKVANDALVATFGRNMIDAILHIMQSETQVILTRVREGFSRIKTQLVVQEAERPKEVAILVNTIKKQKDKKWRDSLGDFISKTSEQCEKAWQVSSALLRTDAYMKEVRQRLDDVMNVMKHECNPDKAVDFLGHEKQYKVKTLFMNNIGLLDLDDLIIGLQDSLKMVFTVFENSFRAFLIDFFMKEFIDANASREAKQWLIEHVSNFWNLKSEDILFLKEAEHYVLATGKDMPGMTFSSVRKAFTQKLERRFKTIVGNLVKEVLVVKLNAEDRKVYFSGKVGRDQKILLLCARLRENLNKLDGVLKDKLAKPITEELAKRKTDLLERLFRTKRCASYLLMSRFFLYVTGFNAMKEKNLNVAVGLNHTIGFVRNRINELLESDKLGEVDGFWFETWVKTKAILSDFYVLWNKAATPNAWLPYPYLELRMMLGKMIEGDQPASNDFLLRSTDIGASQVKTPKKALFLVEELLASEASQSESVLTSFRADFHPQLLADSSNQSGSYKGLEFNYKFSEKDAYPVKVLEENTDKSTCICVFLDRSPFETKDLHQLFGKHRAFTDEFHGIDQLTSAICLVAKTDWFIMQDASNAKELQRTWAKLVEAAFPVIDDVPMHAKARKGDSHIKLFDLGEGNMVRACADVFKAWFGYSLDEFLQNYSKTSKQDPNRYVAPMLIGVAEMFKTPVLVKVDSIEYMVDPIFRQGKARQAFLLCWDPKYGFSPRKASDRFSSMAPSLAGGTDEGESNRSKKKQRLAPSSQ